MTEASAAPADYLRPRGANHVALSPVVFLRRSAALFPRKTAVVQGGRRISYEEFYERACRLASALARAGVAAGDAVAVMAPNVPALLEAHYGVPMAGAVLTAINTRLDAGTVAYILRHSEAKVLIADRDYADTLREALRELEVPPRVIDVVDEAGLDGHPAARQVGDTEYESFLRGGRKTLAGGGGRGSTNDVGIFWPPGQPPIVVVAYLTHTQASAADRNGAIAAVARQVTATRSPSK